MKKLMTGFTRRIKTANQSSSSSNGLNPNRRFSFGSNSAKSLNIQVVRGGYNIDLTQVDATFSKLHKACFLNYDEDKVRKYLKQGENPNQLDNVARSSPLHLAVVNNNIAAVKLLMANGAHLDLVDGDGKTALIKAMECSHRELVQYFVFSGTDVNVADTEGGNTALHVALNNGFLDGAQLLLKEASVDVNKCNFQAESPLHLVVKNPELRQFTAMLVVDRGAQIDARDDRGRTPLMIAAANGNREAAQVLLHHGARTDLVDANGLTPGDVAKKNSHTELASLINGTGMIGGTTAGAKSSNQPSNNASNIPSTSFDDWSDSEASTVESEHAKANPMAFNPVIEQLQKIQGIARSQPSSDFSDTDNVQHTLQPSTVRRAVSETALMNQTIVEEYEQLTTADPTPGQSMDSLGPTTSVPAQQIKLEWNSSDDDDDDGVPAFFKPTVRRNESDPLLSPPKNETPERTLVKSGGEATNDPNLRPGARTQPKKASPPKSRDEDAFDHLDKVLGADVGNDDFIRQIKDLLDEEIKANDDLDAMLMEDAYAPSPVDRRPQASSFSGTEAAAATAPVAFVASFDDSDSSSSRRSSGQSIGKVPLPAAKMITSGPSSRRSSLDAIAEVKLKSAPPAAKSLPPVKSIIRPPLISFNLEDSDDDNFSPVAIVTKALQKPLELSTASIELAKFEQPEKPSVAREELETPSAKSDDSWQEMQSHDKANHEESAVKFHHQLEPLEEQTIAANPRNSASSIERTSRGTVRESTQLDDDVGDFLKRIKKLELELAEEKRERESIEERLSLTNGGFEKVKRDFQEAFKQRLDLESQVFKLQSEMSKVSYDKGLVEARLEGLQRECDVLKSGQEDGRHEVGCAPEEKELLIKENLSLKKQLDEFRNGIKKVDKIEETTDDKSKLESEKLIAELRQTNSSLKTELRKCKEKLSERESELQNQRVEFEAELQIAEKLNERDKVDKDELRRKISSLKEKLFVTEEQLQRKKSHELVADENRLNKELVDQIRDLSDVVLKLDEKTTKLSNGLNQDNQEKALTASVLANATKQIDSRIDVMFDTTRSLLKDISTELDGFKELIRHPHEAHSSPGHENRNGNVHTHQSGLNGHFESVPRSETEASAVRYSPPHVVRPPPGFESKIIELQSNIEKLEDNMQQQELQLLLGPRQQAANGVLFSNYLSQIAPDRRPKSMFVQTLLQLQTRALIGNSDDQMNAANNLSNNFVNQSSFHSAKSNLAQQIEGLKSDLGIYVPSYEAFDVEQ